MRKLIKKSDKLIIFSVLLICLCVLGTFIPAVTARDPFAPSWLKEGAYAKYTADNSGRISIFDVTDPKFEGLNYLHAIGRHDIIEYSHATLMWRCINVNATTAKLRVTFDYIGDKLYQPNLDGYYTGISLGGEFDQRTGEVYVDLYTRAVYNVDGVFLGTTRLWLPANPRVGQEITIWETDDEIIKFPVARDVASLDFDNWIPAPTIYIGHPQSEEIFWTWHWLEINGNLEEIYMSYDLDTGVCLYDQLDWDPFMAAIGISRNTFLSDEGSAGRWVLGNQFGCSETNIDNVNIIVPDTANNERTNWFETFLNMLMWLFLCSLVVSFVVAIIWVVIRKFKKSWAESFRLYLFYCLVPVVVYPIYLMIQSVEITKVMIEVIVALLGFFSVIAVYLLTSNGERLKDLRERLLKEKNETDRKRLCDEISKVSERMKKTSGYMRNGFILFSVSLASSILLLCAHIKLKDPLARLISLSQAPGYSNIMHRDFRAVEIASTSESIMVILQVLTGIIMIVTLFMGIIYLWEIIKSSRQEQKETLDELEALSKVSQNKSSSP